MGDSIAERMDAGWQAARHWETECEAARAERNAHLETIRETFHALESRGQAPDDNAPLFVTVRRVLDYLDRVTAQRDALNARVELLEAMQRADATAALYVGTERDALKAELTALRKRIADAPRTMLYPRDEGEKTEWVAHLRLEDGE